MAVIDASSEKTKWFLNGEDKGGPRAKFAKKKKGMRVFLWGGKGVKNPTDTAPDTGNMSRVYKDHGCWARAGFLSYIVRWLAAALVGESSNRFQKRRRKKDSK